MGGRDRRRGPPLSARRIRLQGLPVLQERVDGIDRIRLLFHSGGEITGEHVVAFDEDVYTAVLGENPEYDTGILQLGYTSMVTPATVYDFDVAAKTLTDPKSAGNSVGL